VRQPGDILLIACYELGHQPLSLASPIGFLARAGYPATALDASVQELSTEAIARARFVGIAVPMHTAMRLGVRVAARVRAINPSAHLCFYGLYASLNAAYLLEHVADSVIGGEYEQPLLDLIQALASSVGHLATGSFLTPSVPARQQGGGDATVAIRVEGMSARDRLAAPVLRRTEFAVPMRDGLPPLHHYAHLEWNGERRPAGYVEASRGCVHKCLHCPITPVYDGRFFVVPREVVLADVEGQVRQGAVHITFGDPDFLNGPTHSLKLVRQMHRQHPQLTFDMTTKVEHILQHRSLFAELRELGCIFVVSAIESFSDLVLARLEKGHTRADITAALVILGEAGIPMRPSLVAFTPWTTRDDYREMLDLVEARDLIDRIDPVQYSIRLLVPPGSALLSRPETHEWLGELDPAAFIYHWRHPDSTMDELHTEVTARVADAARRVEDPFDSFTAIRTLADAHLGRRPQLVPALTLPARSCPHPDRARPPRLTEAWFC
jgi:radical SAM superfamily enzyme YgiQ (UPF0313 family)